MTDEQEHWLVVPGSSRRQALPHLAPRELGGFHFARVFDNPPEGSDTAVPWGRIEDAATRRRVLDYLTGGTLVRESSVFGVDLIDADRHFAVQAGYRTDGRWIWPHAVAYYLEQHAAAPEPELLQHILATGQPPAVPRDLLDTARDTVREYLAEQRDRVDEWLRRAGLTPTRDRPEPVGDESRFSPEVNQKLLDLGWHRGRNIREAVDRWLVRRSPVYDGLHPDDIEPYALVQPALDMMYEFGGLSHLGGLPGKTQGTVSFDIYPVTGDENLDPWWPRIQEIGEQCEVRLCQVGDVERGQGALAVDEDGHVYIAGPANFHVGDTIEEGLARLIEGGPDINEI